MRRIIFAIVAFSIAFTPFAFQDLTNSVPSAHADLGWCDTCVAIGF